jgi:hypothetical protein
MTGLVQWFAFLCSTEGFPALSWPSPREWLSIAHVNWMLDNYNSIATIIFTLYTRTPTPSPPTYIHSHTRTGTNTHAHYNYLHQPILNSNVFTVLDHDQASTENKMYHSHTESSKGSNSGFWVWVFDIALRPQTPKHTRGGWSHYTDTSEPVNGNGAQNMVTVQPGFRTSDLSITGPTLTTCANRAQNELGTFHPVVYRFNILTVHHYDTVLSQRSRQFHSGFLLFQWSQDLFDNVNK